MITLTSRQALDVQGEIAGNKSWVIFREFLTVRTLELKTEAEVLGEDLTKLLKREQMLGAESELLKLMRSFEAHVNNNTTDKEQHEQEV